MPSNSGRMNKINEELKKAISNVISVELKNPHLTGLITVTKVDTSPDLKIAYVYVSMIGAKSNKENLTILKKAAGLDTASGEPNKKKVATLSSAKVREIAELKMPDLNAASVEAAMSMIAGTARSMGIVVED